MEDDNADIKYLDVSKALDKISHYRLLEKRKNLGKYL